MGPEETAQTAEALQRDACIVSAVHTAPMVPLTSSPQGCALAPLSSSGKIHPKAGQTPSSPQALLQASAPWTVGAGDCVRGRGQTLTLQSWHGSGRRLGGQDPGHLGSYYAMQAPGLGSAVQADSSKRTQRRRSGPWISLNPWGPVPWRGQKTAPQDQLNLFPKAAPRTRFPLPAAPFRPALETHGKWETFSPRECKSPKPKVGRNHFQPRALTFLSLAPLRLPEMLKPSLFRLPSAGQTRTQQAAGGKGAAA